MHLELVFVFGWLAWSSAVGCWDSALYSIPSPNPTHSLPPISSNWEGGKKSACKLGALGGDSKKAAVCAINFYYIWETHENSHLFSGLKGVCVSSVSFRGHTWDKPFAFYHKVSPPDIHRGVNWLFGGLSKALFSKQLVPIPAVVTAAQSYECVSPGT